ncbi:hypothetical protein FQN54_003490 [Arachnomyces sp. PD_36]|nr:hypothetical protein FQN54_003490 [Arachnomyces sp. PD_36]
MFSRALFGRHACPQFSRCSAYKPPGQPLRWDSRFFSRSNRLQAPKKKKLVPNTTRTNTPKPSPPKQDPTPATHSVPVREPPSGARLARFENFLTANGGNVVLFKAPPHGSYMFGAYSVAAFCYAYAGINYYATAVDPRLEVGNMEKMLFGGICIVMAAMGTVFLLRASRLISSVVAVQTKGTTRLDIKVRRLVPFLKEREFSIHPSQLSCTRQVVVAPKSPSERAVDELKKAESDALAQTSFFKAPIKRSSYAMWKVFISARRLFSQEHFVHLKVEGKRGTLRMDTTGDVSNGFFLLNNIVKEV